MPVYLVALIDALAYLGEVPVCVAFCADGNTPPRFGAGVAVFDEAAALRRARRDMARRASRKPRRKADLSFLWDTLKNLRPDRFALWGRLGLGDAAATALACGALRALAAALGLRAREAEIDLAPDFASGTPRVAVQGMLRARVGHIIVAAARGQTMNAKERFIQWTDARSKASWPPPWRASAT